MENIGRRILININQDETECEVTILPSTDQETGLDTMSLIAYLQSKNIIFGIDEQCVMENVILAEETKQRVTFIAARAIPPINGMNGSIEMKISFPVEETKKLLTSQKTTYSGAKVNNGQLLAIIQNKADEGSPGTTVLGNPIPSKRGNKIHLMAGKNVKIEMGDKEVFYYATANGIAFMENNDILYVKTYSDGFFEIQITPDKLSLYITIVPPTGGGSFVDSKEIIEYLLNEQIRLTEEKILEIRKLIYHVSSENIAIDRYELLKGTPPLHGENSRIEFKVDITPLKIITEKEEKINFYNILKINAVSKGELLAVKIPPTKGQKDGINIFGEPIPAEDGKDIQKLQPGKNISISEDGLSFFSNIDGQVKYEHNMIWVSPTFIVNGDVNFSVGNIDFNGDVIIKGNVLDNFQVKADDNIIIYNSVQCANIYAGGNLIVKNGIINRKKSSIIVQGNMSCRFMENSSAEVNGSVFIEDYFLNSELTCKETVEISSRGKGQILGGEILAIKGVKAKTIGNENEILTRIYTGQTYFHKKKFMILNEAILEVQKKSTLLSQTLEELLKNGEMVKYQEELKNKIMLSYNLEKMMGKKAEILDHLEKQTLCSIKVSGAIYPNTELILNDKKIIIKKLDTFKNFYYNIKENNIIIENYSKSRNDFSA